MGEDLLGPEFHLNATEGNLHVGDTMWHGGTPEPDRLPSIKIAFYLEPTTRDTGAIRLIPGSNNPEYRRYLQVLYEQGEDPSVQPLGVSAPDLPCHVAETEPGDLVIFPESTWHGAFGGPPGRSQHAVNFTKNPENEEERAWLRSNYEGWLYSLHPVPELIESDRPAALQARRPPCGDGVRAADAHTHLRITPETPGAPEMKITDIEAIPLRLPYEARIRKRYHHFSMNEEVTVYKFHTDAGLTGLGENPGPPFAQEVLDPYLGSDPFDHVMSTGRFNLDMACYDLMGKQLGIPAWKLLGQQRRQWVSMGWWMPSMSPEDSAAEVEEAASLGYRGLKCKARPFYDVVEQARAMQEAAPPDFRVEFDFNGALINVEKALPVLRELENIPVVKGVEEPIFAHDVEGWRRLHRQIRIPFYLHGSAPFSTGPRGSRRGPGSACAPATSTAPSAATRTSATPWPPPGPSPLPTPRSCCSTSAPALPRPSPANSAPSCTRRCFPA